MVAAEDNKASLGRAIVAMEMLAVVVGTLDTVVKGMAIVEDIGTIREQKSLALG